MRFFLDHDVAADVAMVLRQRGHDIVELRTVLAPTTSDEAVWAHACADARIMVSCNRAHFLALATATETHPGLIVLNRRRTRQAEAAHLLELLARLASRAWRTTSTSPEPFPGSRPMNFDRGGFPRSHDLCGGSEKCRSAWRRP